MAEIYQILPGQVRMAWVLVPLLFVVLGAFVVYSLTGADVRFAVRKIMGTAIGGYSSGWFRLRDGERALLYVTERSQVIYIPMTDGYILLLTPQAPAAFLKSLNRLR